MSSTFFSFSAHLFSFSSSCGTRDGERDRTQTDEQVQSPKHPIIALLPLVPRSKFMGSTNIIYPLERSKGFSWTGTSSLPLLSSPMSFPLSPFTLFSSSAVLRISFQIRWDRGWSQADSITYSQTGKMPCLEECTRTVSKAFSICATDRYVLLLSQPLWLSLLQMHIRNDVEIVRLMGRTFKGFESRRRGVYHVACLSMKCYFKVSPP